MQLKEIQSGVHLSSYMDFLDVGIDRLQWASVTVISQEEKEILRKTLKLQLEQVEGLLPRIAARQDQLRKELDQRGRAAHSDLHLSRTDNGGSTPSFILSTDRLRGRPGVVGKEKRTRKANLLYLNSEFVSGTDMMPSPAEKFKSNAGTGTKRGAPWEGDTRAGTRDAKRGKVDSAHSKRMADIMKQCATLLRKLIYHKHAWVFNEPVDIVKLGLDDYFKFIKKPMDLGTIKKKLDSGMYTQPDEFAEDIRLTFSNAMMYNPKGHDVYVMADILRELFEKRWKDLEDKVDEDRLKTEVKEDVLAAESEGQRTHYQDLKNKIENIENKVESLAKKPAGARRPPAQPKPRPDDVEKRPMTFDEKLKLSFALENLPSHKYERMVEIIKKRNAIKSRNEDEIEVDIGSLDNDTLWELDRFVTNWAKSKGRLKTKAPPKLPKELTLRPDRGSSQFPDIGTWKNPEKSSKGVVAEEEDVDVDIDDDIAPPQYEPIVIEKDASGSSSSSSASSDSGSSSSGSSSSSSLGSDSDSGSSSSDSDSASSLGSNSDAEEPENVEITSKGSPTVESE